MRIATLLRMPGSLTAGLQVRNERRRRSTSRRFLLFIFLAVLAAAMPGSAIAGDGDLDPTFGNGGKQMIQIAAGQREYITTLAIQADGKILGAGELGDFASDGNRVVLFRLNFDGSLDQTFGTGGTIITNSQIHAPKLIIQPDGKFITAAATTILGDTWDFAVKRYNADGSLDQTFGNNGYASNGNGHAQSILLQPDGKIVILGFLPIFRNGTDYLAARFNADGTVDQTFGIGGRVQTSFTSGLHSADKALSGALQSDGKIILSGYAGGFSPVMIRYNPDGSIDYGFGLDGIVMSSSFGATANSILVQPDGKIVVSGGGFVVARYNSNGTTDQTFGTNGRVAGGFGTGNGYAKALTIDRSGRLIVSGSVCYTNTGNCAFLIGRYNPNGAHDPKFGTNGFVITEFTGALDEANTEVLQGKNGRLIAAGYAAEPGASNVDFSLARYITSTNLWAAED
jgi:uncharacterized delta-60 repeat protein